MAAQVKYLRWNNSEPCEGQEKSLFLKEFIIIL